MNEEKNVTPEKGAVFSSRAKGEELEHH